MRPRPSWLLGAAGILAAALLGIAVARFTGLSLGPASPSLVSVSYRLTDVPSSTPAAAARDTTMRVIARRLASHRLVNRVDSGAKAGIIDIQVKNSTAAEVASIVEADGPNLTICKWTPGPVDEATQSRLGPLAAQYHPGYHPVLTGIDGTMIIHASVGRVNRPPGPAVIITFDTDGAELLNLLTKDRSAQTYETVDNRIAVFLDSRLFEDAAVSAEITKGAMVLVPDVGIFTPAEALRIADGINAGTIPGKITRISG